MRRLQIHSIVLAATVLLGIAQGPLAAQTTWVVDRQGTGQFTKIQDAIDVAAPGDRIEVLGTGTYAGFRCSKGLDIEALGGAILTPQQIPIQQGPVIVLQDGPCIEVRDVPGGEHVLVVGFTTGPVNDTAVEVAGCAGPVLFEKLLVPGIGLGGPALSVDDCGAFFLLDSTLEGGPPNNFQSNVGAIIRNSRAVLQDSTISGGDGADGPPITPVMQGGTEALVLEFSFVQASACTFQGGQGGDTRAQGQVPGTGGNAVFVEPDPIGCTSLTFEGTFFNLGCVLQGGAPGLNLQNSGIIGATGEALEIDYPQAACFGFPVVYVDFSCLLNGIPSCPPTIGPWVCIDVPPQLRVASRPTSSFVEAPLGSTQQVDVVFWPQQNLVYYVSTGLDNFSLANTSFFAPMPLLLDGSLVSFGTANTGASGLASVNFTIANSPSLAGRVFYLQAVDGLPGQPSAFPYPALSNVLALRVR